MTRMRPFASPLLLGFDAMEKTVERIAKASDGYPPYNIERLRRDAASGLPERLRITLAVAGFSEDELEVTTEENQLDTSIYPFSGTDGDDLRSAVAFGCDF